jgi:hypothetical protein
MKEFLLKAKDKFYGNDLKTSLHKLKNYEKLLNVIIIFSGVLSIASVCTLILTNQIMYMYPNFFFTFLTFAPQLFYKQISKKRKLINNEANNYLKTMINDLNMYQLELILFLNSPIKNLDDIEKMLNLMKEKKASYITINHLNVMFHYESEKQNNFDEIEQFIKNNQYYLDKSTNELENLVQEKINHYLNEKEKSGGALNEFLKQRQKNAAKLALKL